MPIYEYKCRDCGASLEKMQRVSEAPLTVCEACGGKLEKQVSLSGFQFKGEGWYVTDYSSKKNNQGGKTGKSENTESTGTAEKTEKTEKNSTSESTGKSESASNTKSDTPTASKKD